MKTTPFLFQYKRHLLVILGLVLCVGVGAGFFFWYRSARVEQSVFDEETTLPVWRSSLTGLPVFTEAEERPQVVGIMFDNHTDARPQSGIDQADVVYEAPVEGGITRFFGIFSAGTTVSKVGPVRSARPYFLDWLAEYGDAMYMHAGGSPEALSLIKERDLFDANEFSRGAYYWRDSNRFAPHNLYSSSDNWLKMVAKYGAGRMAMPWEGWKFIDKKVVTTTPGLPSVVMVAYAHNYVVSWQYDISTDRYTRFLNKKPYSTEEGVSIIADSVVFASMKVTTIDNEGRRAIETVGSGDAVVLVGGKLIRALWKKSSLAERTRWYDEKGEEIALAPGKTWIQIVPLEISLTIGSGG